MAMHCAKGGDFGGGGGGGAQNDQGSKNLPLPCLRRYISVADSGDRDKRVPHRAGDVGKVLRERHARTLRMVGRVAAADDASLGGDCRMDLAQIQVRVAHARDWDPNRRQPSGRADGAIPARAVGVAKQEFARDALLLPELRAVIGPAMPVSGREARP